MLRASLLATAAALTASRASGQGQGLLTSGLPLARAEDFRGLRIFVYDLPAAFHEELLDAFEAEAQASGATCDFLRSPCTEETWASKYSAHRQHGAEVVLLRKLLAAGQGVRVEDPREADIFVVPYLAALDCFLGGFLPRCPRRFSAIGHHLLEFLHYYSPATRHRHLFLATAPMTTLPFEMQAQTLIVTDGASWQGSPGHIIAPAASAEVEFQPGVFQDLPWQHRDILFFLAQTPTCMVRIVVEHQILSFAQEFTAEERGSRFGLEGDIRIHGTQRSQAMLARPEAKAMVAEMLRSKFCPALPTETSGGLIRLLDVVRSGCIPVVVAFPTRWGSGVSWWRTDGPPVEWSLPYADRIDWRNLVVEVQVGDLTMETESGLAGFVEACRRLSSQELEAKRQQLLDVRSWLVYDFVGGSQDAFSLFMDVVRDALQSFQGPAHAWSALRSGARGVVCQSQPRMAFHRKLPTGFGLGDTMNKVWSHSFGEFACLPVHMWQPLGDLFIVPGGVKANVSASQYAFQAMFTTAAGDTAWLKTLTSTAIAPGREQEALASSALATCIAGSFPIACHDYFREDEQDIVPVWCHDVEGSQQLNIAVDEVCTLIPAATPLPRSLAQSTEAASGAWAILAWSCGMDPTALRELAEEVSNERGPRADDESGHSSLQHLVVHDVCGRAGGRALLHELLRLIHDLGGGQTAGVEHIMLVSEGLPRPWRFLRTALTEVEDLARTTGPASAATLYHLLGEGSGIEGCMMYEEFFNVRCPDSEAPSGKLALAFKADLLRRATLSRWHWAASLDVEDVSAQGMFDLIHLLLLEISDGVVELESVGSK